MLGTIIWGIVGGAIIGILGRLLLPGKQNISMLMTVVAGILAATLGGIIADWLGVGDTKGIDWWRHAIQLALAIFFVWLVARFMGRRGPTGTTGAVARPR
ncbi:hypothetical protein Rhe02_60290 [Rhizocola hellebori]|uniref:GlsB/YeaQ/YmgE family stress response membrane protein n=1 Tax=Rhizocola hellebori TaxID=1392758 RepID=A0A8J3VJ12_9ACTN|nr:GlsB/YeaQ/YmgE family stress response membrane protein [Rhizocola hellebori]GIH07962.1 hypothetical protein Rhe02_60290 [Rhizocola hellebori]